MRAKQFNELLNSVRLLMQTQQRKLTDATLKASAIDHTVAATNECMTPEYARHSQYSHRWGCEDAIQRYRCQDCRSTFDSLTGTSLARLKQRSAWNGFAQSLLREATKAAGSSRATSFRWRRRLLAVSCERRDGELTDVVEPDETTFLESFKGCHKMPSKSRKRAGSAAKRGLLAEQIPVLPIHDRNGEHFDAVLPVIDKATLGVLLPQLLVQHSVCCIDGAGSTRRRQNIGMCFARRASE